MKVTWIYGNWLTSVLYKFADVIACEAAKAGSSLLLVSQPFFLPGQKCLKKVQLRKTTPPPEAILSARNFYLSEDLVPR